MPPLAESRRSKSSALPAVGFLGHIRSGDRDRNAAALAASAAMPANLFSQVSRKSPMLLLAA
jgi:hypothetical protein